MNLRCHTKNERTWKQGSKEIFLSKSNNILICPGPCHIPFGLLHLVCYYYPRQTTWSDDDEEDVRRSVILPSHTKDSLLLLLLLLLVVLFCCRQQFQSSVHRKRPRGFQDVVPSSPDRAAVHESGNDVHTEWTTDLFKKHNVLFNNPQVEAFTRRLHWDFHDFPLNLIKSS